MKRLFSIVIFGVLALTGTRADARYISDPKVYIMQKDTREIPLFDDFKVKARRYYLARDGEMDMGPRTRCILYKGNKKIAKKYNGIYAIGKTIIYEMFLPARKPPYKRTEVGFLTHEGTPIKIENCISIEGLVMKDGTNIGISYTSDRYFEVYDKQYRRGVADSLGQLIIQYEDQSIMAVSRNVIATVRDRTGTCEYYNMRGERIDYTPKDAPWSHSPASGGPRDFCAHWGGGWRFDEMMYFRSDISWNQGYVGYNNCNYTISSVRDCQLLHDPQGVPVTDTVYSIIYPLAYNYAIVFKRREGGAFA